MCPNLLAALTLAAQSSRLAEFGGRGMSFNICRGTLGSLAMLAAIRRATRSAVYSFAGPGLGVFFGARVARQPTNTNAMRTATKIPNCSMSFMLILRRRGGIKSCAVSQTA